VTLLAVNDGTGSSGFDIGKNASSDRIAASIMRWSNVLVVTASVTVLNEGLLSPAYANIPQILALIMWVVLIGVSVFVRPVIRTAPGTDLIVYLAFYGWAITSVLWSNWSPAAAMKCAALLITTVGAFRLATRLSIEDIVRTTSIGLFLPLLASIILVVLMPDVAVDQSWMHGGQWQGIFASKQSLGFLAAYLMFFALFRRMSGDSWLVCGTIFLMSVAAVVGSGSRGAAALALVTCASLLAARFSRSFAKLVAFWPLVITIMASGLMLYLYSTGYDHFPVFGTKIDLTERTFIWEYSLRHFDNHPLLGYGLNGFWSTEVLYDAYRNEHGWVLDNFHSGYVGILIETGIVGFTLFFFAAVLFAVRMVALISSGAVSMNHCAFMVCFAALSFQMNLTETSFLRSTSYYAILLVATLFVSCQPTRPAT
jgi:O-antigen ligase